VNSMARNPNSLHDLQGRADDVKSSTECPVCGATIAVCAPIRHVGRYRLFECDACNVQFWNPFKRLGAVWYEDFYTGHQLYIPPLEPGHKFFLADSRAPKKGSLLDIGCGAGNFMAAARAVGFDVSGIDWDSKAVQMGRDVLGLEKIFPLSIEEFTGGNRSQKFDVVSFFEVLEHQDDPVGFLSQVRQLVKPGGYIALSVPNRDRWEKGMDITDLPPNHLTRWNPKVLTAFLHRCGFETISVREEPIGLRRTAAMLSAAVPTGLVRVLLGGSPPNSTELAENPQQVRDVWERQSRFGRNHIVSFLLKCKNCAFILPALLFWPYCRAKHRPGVYLYCLAQWKG